MRISLEKKSKEKTDSNRSSAMLILILCAIMIFPPEAVMVMQARPEVPEKKFSDIKTEPPQTPVKEEIKTIPGTDTPDSISTADKTSFLDAEMLVRVNQEDTTKTIVVDPNSPYGLDGKIPFNPQPERAVWLSALFPGLGQIYNRRYWKLPIVVGGFMGLGYATSWNNRQFKDYSQAYRDLSDNDPSSNSYMNFFPPTTDESSLDKSWLSSTLRSRRNFYRRNRDLCIICMVALYLVCMIDAYVDASMAHFDISPDLSMDMAPTMIMSPGTKRPAIGLNWALTF